MGHTLQQLHLAVKLYLTEHRFNYFIKYSHIY